MSFLNPAMLFGMTALAIPIIVHLLNRRRFKKIQWAAMRFLQVSLERNQRRMKVEDWILLLLRMAIVALIALAASRPATDWLKSKGLSSKVTASVIIDSSASMLKKDASEQENRFSIARKIADEVLNSLPKGSATSMVLGANSSGKGIKEPTHDMARAQKVLEESKATHRGSDLFPAIQSAITTMQDRPSSQKELVIITDGEASAWRQYEAITRSLDQSKKDTNAIIVLVGKDPDENLAITRLDQKTPIASVDQPVRLAVEVTNFGNAEANDVEVQMSINDEPIGDPAVIEAIPPGESRTITTFVELSNPGYQRISSKINVNDALETDNSREIVIRGINKARALLVDGQPGRDITESETFFLQNALVPVPPELADSFFLGADRISIGDLANAQLDDYRAIFLANVSDFPDEFLPDLINFVESGGGLVIFPGENINVSFYNKTLHEKAQLLPATFGEIIPEQGQENTLTIQASGYNHPLVDLWNDPGAGTLSNVKTLKAYKLSLGDTLSKNKATVALRYNDGSAAVVESDYGLGKVYQFSSTADTDWNDLPVKPAFLPIVHRVFGSILSKQDSGININVGETFIRKGPSSWTGKKATISYNDSPTASEISATEESNGSSIEYNNINESGIYSLTIHDPFELIQFSASGDPRESSPETLSDAQKERLREVSLKFLETTDPQEISAALKRERKGAELWPVLLLIAALITVLELFLSQKFSQEK
ncbi:MAG: BatA domain-containing protein [Verrucomicrobiota bacterium]|nr:BatA domain-containing protein [Verrucomicrobiales bacterium]MEC9037810.1 BatA domain-containing protein [Verrucomicrobiota bacterium]